MRLYLAILVVLFCGAATCAQTERQPEQVIRRIINGGIYEGHDAKILSGIGDRAAVLITKVVADKPLSTQQIDGILLVLHISFAGDTPLSSDQEPRTAFFVLQSCDLATHDPGVKKRIAETRAFIQQRVPEAKS